MMKKAQQDISSLTEKEYAQYERQIIIALDVWDKAIFAESDGLIEKEHIDPWHMFYHSWVKRHMDKEMWDELKWNWESPELSARIEAALRETD